MLVLGGALSLFNAVFGVGVSIGIPFTQSNVTVAGSIGTKDKVVEALPNYTDRLVSRTSLTSIRPRETPTG